MAELKEIATTLPLANEIRLLMIKVLENRRIIGAQGRRLKTSIIAELNTLSFHFEPQATMYSAPGFG